MTSSDCSASPFTSVEEARRGVYVERRFKCGITPNSSKNDDFKVNSANLEAVLTPPSGGGAGPG